MSNPGANGSTKRTGPARAHQTTPLLVPLFGYHFVGHRKGNLVTESATVGLRTDLDARIADHDRAGAARVVLDTVRAGSVTLDDVYTRVLTPLLVDTGASWLAGTTRVWEEHFASSVVRTIIESLHLDAAQAAEESPRLGRTVVLACPAGEQHDLGLRMLSERLLLCGWDTYFLGADTPAAEVVAAAQSLGADLVALSAATHYNLVLLRSYVDEVKSGLPGVRIGVGGPAFACNHRWPAEDLLVAHELGLPDDPAGFCPLPESEG
jgi:MerR family transcriptional regulator, light-induced transcriptional regulator